MHFAFIFSLIDRDTITPSRINGEKNRGDCKQHCFTSVCSDRGLECNQTALKHSRALLAYGFMDSVIWTVDSNEMCITGARVYTSLRITACN